MRCASSSALIRLVARMLVLLRTCKLSNPLPRCRWRMSSRRSRTGGFPGSTHLKRGTKCAKTVNCRFTLSLKVELTSQVAVSNQWRTRVETMFSLIYFLLISIDSFILYIGFIVFLRFIEFSLIVTYFSLIFTHSLMLFIDFHLFSHTFH